MKGLLLVAGWWLLCAAGPLPAVDPPATVPLGEALTLRYRLPAADLQLPGLPPLSGLQQLQPPQQANGFLTWRLLAVRPGAQSVPALVLEDAAGQRWETAELSLDISAPPLAADARPADLKPLSAPPADFRLPAWSWWLLAPLFLGLVLTRRQLRRPGSPETRDQRLARLAALLETPPGAAPPEAAPLRQLVGQLRFAPGAPPEVDLDHLETRIQGLVGTARRREP